MDSFIPILFYHPSQCPFPAYISLPASMRVNNLAFAYNQYFLYSIYIDYRVTLSDFSIHMERIYFGYVCVFLFLLRYSQRPLYSHYSVCCDIYSHIINNVYVSYIHIISINYQLIKMISYVWRKERNYPFNLV